jgi:hypothetical protein
MQGQSCNAGPCMCCRQRLIGKDVSVSLEYNRKVQPMPGEGAGALSVS